MTRKILLLTIALTLGTAWSFGQTWQLTSTMTGTLANGVLTISGTGRMPYAASNGPRYPWSESASLIKEVIIEDGVTTIGDFAFDRCDALESVTLPNSVTWIGWASFRFCSKLTSISLPDWLTTIDWEAFSFTGLTSIRLPNSLQEIAKGTFEECHSLVSVIIPNSITSIGEQAFRNCYELPSIAIPNSVTSIGSWAFGQCRKLSSVIVEWQTPLSISSDVFEWLKFESCDLIVPQGTKDLYKDADVWKNFARITYLNSEQVSADINVYADEANLYISTPSIEDVETYTISGALIYKGVKQAGLLTIPIETRESILIVKGSSGWTRKIPLK